MHTKFMPVKIGVIKKDKRKYLVKDMWIATAFIENIMEGTQNTEEADDSAFPVTWK